MNKIAVLSTFYSETSANGICAKNIVTELKKAGHIVDVICYETRCQKTENDESIHSFTCPKKQKKTIFSRLFFKIQLAFKLLFGIGEPVFNKSLITNYYNILSQLKNTKKIDTVIAMYFPAESLKAAVKFKKKNPNVKLLNYELDSVGDGVAAKSKMFSFTNRIYEKWLKKAYADVDSVIIMHSHINYWMNTFGKMYSDKLRITDLPVLYAKTQFSSTRSECISMVYAGVIQKKFRSPSYLLEVLYEISKTLDFKFDFFSKGDCENEIAEAAKKIKGISQSGYIPQDELQKVISNSDFLISIGNSVSRSVPSKIIDYISHGKPIIHFSSQKDDVCNEYFDKYPLALIVDETQPVTYSCTEIIEFINKNRGKTVDKEEIKKIFFMNDPAYSAKIISDIII